MMVPATTMPPEAATESAPAARTFLIADVRGYTHFTVERGDEAGARLAARFSDVAEEVVAAHGGTVTELRGDEALAVFASARQALRAALELQARFAREVEENPTLPLTVGVGLDAGEAIPVKGGYRGAALNLAARLCSLAGAGEVLASEGVVHLARRVEGLNYLERGVVQLKGFTDPVRVVQVVLAEAVPMPPDERAGMVSRHPLPIGGFLGALPAGPLVARDDEVRTVMAAVDAVAGGSGRLVFLAGEPGVGKTRVAQEVTLRLRDRGFLVASGRCYEPQRAIPFYPFLEGLGALYLAAPPSARSAVPQRWPYLNRLLPNENVAGPPGSPEGREEQERLFWSVTGFVQTLAEHQPVAFLLDDLHWADASSLALLQHLARHTRAYRVLLLGTYRDVEVGRQHPLEQVLRDLGREQLTERVPIRRLGQDGTAALIATTLGEEAVSTDFLELVYRRTEGNPFFTQEVLRALVERGDIYRENGRWGRREIEALFVPESVRSVIGERLSRLREETQQLLHEASVLGQTFRFEDLQAMGGSPEVRIEAALEEAIAAGLVREAGRDEHSFNHALIQQTLYAELSNRRKRRLHLAAGEALERRPETDRTERAAELAWHFLEGDDPERALHYSILAGDQAEGRLAYHEVERHYRMALELTQGRGETSTEAALLGKLGKALSSMGRYDEALQVLERAVEMHRGANDLEAEAGVVAQMSQVHANRGTSDEGIAYAEKVVRAREKNDPSPGLAALHASLAILYFRAGRYREQQTAAERAAEVARLCGSDEFLAVAEVSRASALSLLGQREQALAALGDAIALAERVGDLNSLNRALSAMAEMYRQRGQFEESKLYRERALAATQRAGDPAIIAFAMAALGRLYYFQGAWEAASALLERALSLAATTSSWYAAYPSHHLGELRLAQGAWSEAWRLLETAETIGRRNRDMQAVRYAQQTLAELDLLQGRPQAARDRLQPLLDRPGVTELQATALLPVLAQAELELGNVERADGILAETLRRAEAENARLATLDALRVRGDLLSRQRRWTEAQQSCEHAIAMARAMFYPYAEARVLHQLGLLEQQRGEQMHARQHLEEALVIYRRLGAGKDIERAEQVLTPLVRRD